MSDATCLPRLCDEISCFTYSTAIAPPSGPHFLRLITTSSVMATVHLKVFCFTTEYLTLQHPSKRTRSIVPCGVQELSDNLVISGPGRPHTYLNYYVNYNIDWELGSCGCVRRLGACLCKLSKINILGLFSQTFGNNTLLQLLAET